MSLSSLQNNDGKKDLEPSANEDTILVLPDVVLHVCEFSLAENDTERQEFCATSHSSQKVFLPWRPGEGSRQNGFRNDCRRASIAQFS
mmetsp:Transcript_1694/g.4613  ORF Transcript_1694/g.4613 Transcript_1694/m.4613 type:complete len:88 (+) Transcript_1694:198-461(+)